jgi:hypothetical protein
VLFHSLKKYIFLFIRLLPTLTLPVFVVFPTLKLF